MTHKATNGLRDCDCRDSSEMEIQILGQNG